MVNNDKLEISKTNSEISKISRIVSLKGPIINNNNESRISTQKINIAVIVSVNFKCLSVKFK